MPGRITEVARQADALELRIECPFGNAWIGQRFENVRRDPLTAGKVNDLHRRAVHGVTKEQDLKIRRGSVAVNPASGEVYAAVGFDISTQTFYYSHEYTLLVFILLIIH